MAVSRRTRFEVLRRDGHTCQYCGASAPDVQLTVDHVVPEALGGGDEPSNLFTACQPCNAGKSSIAPDQAMDENVDATAKLFSKAMQMAVEIRRGDVAFISSQVEEFRETWSAWGYTDASGERQKIPTDGTWVATIERFLAAGLTLDDMRPLIVTAMTSKASTDAKWRYFCKCCWNEVTERQELALRLIEDGRV